MQDDPEDSMSYKIAWALSEDSDQTAHMRSLIRIFAGRASAQSNHSTPCTLWVAKDPKDNSGGQRKLLWECADMQADLSPRLAHV